MNSKKEATKEEINLGQTIVKPIKGYRPKYFKLQELVSKEMFERYQHRSEYLWSRINPSVLEAADVIRAFYDSPVIVNSWHTGGRYSQSGLRDKKVKGGATLSAHLFGLALDIKVMGVTSATVIDDIKNMKLPKRFYELINQVEVLEATPTWVHIASVNIITDSIQWIKP